jgi:hypothetical protein
MKISERDIFNYVFSRNELDEDKLVFINNNLEKYKEEIELFETSLSAFESEETIELPESLKEQISDDKKLPGRIIKLEKVIQGEGNSNGIVRLAADSPKFEKKISVDTFIDKKDEYIVKIISQDNAANIYVFKNDNSPLENFSLELLPSGRILQYENNRNPIKVDLLPSIENVELHF